MSTYVFKPPDIGEGIAESEIAQWHVAVGDAVEEDAQLVDLLTDKAVVGLSSPVAGRVLQLTGVRSEAHTLDIQSLMRRSLAVFCLYNKRNYTQHKPTLTLNQ